MVTRCRLFLLLALLAPVSALAAPEPAGILAPGTPYATPYYRLEGAAPGPVVFILGGVHGDEPAGYRAARILTHGRVRAGTLIIVPEANRPAIRRRVRVHGETISRFYGDREGTPGQRLVADLWALLTATRPALALTLHESRGFHWRDPKRFGQTFTHDFDTHNPLMRRVLARLNPEIPVAAHRFCIFSYPVEKCFTWVVTQDLGAPATTIETCRQLPLETRVRYQLLAVRAFLEEVGIPYDNRHVPRLQGAAP